MLLRIYRNLHKKCFSVQTKSEKGWRVKEHKHSILIENASFKVIESGRQKVLREKKKNVHAFVVGQMSELHIDQFKKENLINLSYNPYKMDSFYIKETGEPVKNAKFVFLSEKGIFAVL